MPSPQPSKFSPKLVIFDKDGTLIDFNKQWGGWVVQLRNRIHKDERVNQDISEALFQRLGLDISTLTVVPGGPVTATPMSILREYTKSVVMECCGLDEDNTDDLVSQCWTAPDPASTSFPLGDVRGLFHELKQNKVRIAINTTDDRESAQKTMDHLGLSPYVDRMFCGDDPLPSKPAPDSCLYLCQELGVSPQDTVMVGDTVYDLRMGRAAGLGLSVGVSNGSSRAEDLVRDADVIIPSVVDLHTIIHIPVAVC